MANLNDDEKKRWLSRYKWNKAKIDRLEDRLRELDTKITRIRSPNLSGMPRGGTPVTTADLIADKEEIEERIAQLQTRGKQYRREILACIDKLYDDRFADLLECWFIQCMSAEDIASKLNYGVRHVWRLYSQAIEAIEIDD